MPWNNSKRWPALTDEQYAAQWVAKVKARCDLTAEGCWLWTGPKSYNGYAVSAYRSRHCTVHRKMLEIASGKSLPKDHDACHSCDARACCNPAHLWAGTRKENMQDCSAKGRADGQWKTSCKRGHEYTSENTYRSSTGLRHCKACSRGRMRVAAGWPEDLAYSMPTVPHGYRPVNATNHRRKKAA